MTKIKKWCALVLSVMLVITAGIVSVNAALSWLRTSTLHLLTNGVSVCCKFVRSTITMKHSSISVDFMQIPKWRLSLIHI